MTTTMTARQATEAAVVKVHRAWHLANPTAKVCGYYGPGWTTLRERGDDCGMRKEQGR